MLIDAHGGLDGHGLLTANGGAGKGGAGGGSGGMIHITLDSR